MPDLATYLLRSGASLALFYALYWLVLRRETCFALNRGFLLGGAALSLALPLLRVPSPFFETVVYATAISPGTGAPAVGVAARGPGTSVQGILFGIYLAVAGALLILFFARIARLGWLAVRCGCVRHRGLRVVLCGCPGESFSFFNFVFLNRSKIPEEDMDRVLAHELAHVRQLHSFDVVFTELLAALQWFNPLVWPYKRSLRETHEYLADRAVIAQGCGLARYQLLIVEQHVGGRLLELASSFRTSQIKRRIVMLSKQETKGLARWKPLLILPLALVLVLAFAESRTVVMESPAVFAAPASAAPPPQTMSEEDAIKALKEKMVKLEEMKQKNADTMAKLEQKLKSAPDAAAKEKIQAAMKEQKVLSLEIGAKERMLQSKKVELALNKETDAAKKAELENKLKQLQIEADNYMKKAETVRNATAGQEKGKEKAAAEKKAEKK